MRRMIQSVLAGLLVLAGCPLGVTLSPLAAPATALAADATLATCTEASFDTALNDVQASGGGTLTITCTTPIIFSAEKTISTPVTIIGDGATLDGGGATRLFTVDAGARLTLIWLTVRNGLADGGHGGAIYNAGTLDIIASTFSGNSATYGGALYNGGTTTITASTFSTNSALDAGGVILSGSFGNIGTLTISASTFNGNSATYGGALYNGGPTDDSSNADINASTFSGNSASQGGAIMQSGDRLSVVASTFSGNSATGVLAAVYTLGGTSEITASTFNGNSQALFSLSSAPVTVGASILSGSSPGANCAVNLSGTIVSAGYNLSDDASCGLGHATDQQGAGVTVSLGPLQDNGGLTATMLPLSGEAVEAIPAATCLTFSSASGQRGVARPQGNCEIGAVELGPVPTQIATIFNTGPVFPGQPATLIVFGTGPVGAALTFAFDCDNNGSYELNQSEPDAECTFTETGDHVIPVRASDGSTSATGQTVVTVLAVMPAIDSITLDPSPSDEGASVDLTAAFTNPNEFTTHTCEIDWGDGVSEAGQVLEQNGSGTCEGSHTYIDEGTFSVIVTVCHSEACDDDSVDNMVLNVAPAIDSITTNGPVAQGQPVTVTVTASDPGLNDALTYAFDCDDDGSFEVGPQAGGSTSCTLDPARAVTTIAVQVADDDGGLTTDFVEVGQTLTLCGNYSTGNLNAPGVNGCPNGTLPLVLPSMTTTTLCLNPYSGAITWAPSGSCGPNIWTHRVPDDGPLTYCQHLWSGQLRHTWNGQCGAHELAGVIPGTIQQTS